MSTVNFNDTTPAAPTNMVNLKWQSDASGNISAYNSGGSWLTWTPGFSGSSGMTITSITITTAQYLVVGPIVYFELIASFTIGAPLSNTIFFTPPPLALVGANNVLPVLFTGPSQQGIAQASFVNTTTCQVILNPTANYIAGTTTLNVTGFYRCG